MCRDREVRYDMRCNCSLLSIIKAFRTFGRGGKFLSLLQKTLYMKGFPTRLPFVILFCK